MNYPPTFHVSKNKIRQNQFPSSFQSRLLHRNSLSINPSIDSIIRLAVLSNPIDEFPFRINTFLPKSRNSIPKGLPTRNQSRIRPSIKPPILLLPYPASCYSRVSHNRRSWLCSCHGRLRRCHRCHCSRYRRHCFRSRCHRRCHRRHCS